MKIQTKEINRETWIKFDSNFDKFRYYYGNLLTVLLIIFLVIMGSSVSYTILDNMKDLKTNPFIYSANHMRGKGLVECNCMYYKTTEFKSIKSIPTPFYFNNTYWGIKPFGS